MAARRHHCSYCGTKGANLADGVTNASMQTQMSDYMEPEQTVVDIHVGATMDTDKATGSDEQASGEDHDAEKHMGIGGSHRKPRDTGSTGKQDGGKWEPTPQMFMSIVEQQREMLKVMSTMLPMQTSPKNVAAAAGKAPKAGMKRKAAISAHELSDEGEWSDNSEENFEGKLEALCGNNDEQEPELYADIVQFFDKEEKLGTDVSVRTADLVKAAMRVSMSHSKEKELTEKIFRPENCPSLIVPKINPEIWRDIKKETRDADVAAQRTQNLIHKGLVPLLRVMDTLSERKDKENLMGLAEAFRLLAMASSHLSQNRKDAVAPELDYSFRQICTPGRPVTELLFGEDLPKALRDIKDAQQTTSKVTSQVPRGNFRGRFSARSQGHRGDYRGRGDYYNNNNNNTKPRGFLGRNNHRGRGPPQRRYGYQNSGRRQ